MKEMSTTSPAYIFLENALQSNKQKIQELNTSILRRASEIDNIKINIDNMESERRILVQHLDELYLGLKILGDAIPVE